MSSDQPEHDPTSPTEAIPQGSTEALPEWQAPGYPYGTQAPTPYPAPPAPTYSAPQPPTTPPPAQPTAYPGSSQAYGHPAHTQPTFGQPSYGQPAYGQVNQAPPPSALPQQWIPPVGYAGPQPAYPQTNTSALVLLIVSGIMTLSCYFTLVGIAPLILGIIAMTKQNTDWEGSRRLARIGWITMAIVGAICVLAFIAFIGAVIIGDSTSSSYN
ncbi:MAG TPA: hypothetical protein PLA46_01260 [Phycicoccus sp.]|jgi:hypothetical protein|nr:hypothetical protein [Phycicoccus sp.]HQV90178.1 hypothetical protein [Phycicoccus sp.]